MAPNSATLVKKRAVRGNNDLPSFKLTELEESSQNLLESVQQAAVTGGDRGLRRTRGTDCEFTRRAVVAGEQIRRHSAVPSWHPAQPGGGGGAALLLLSSGSLETVLIHHRGPAPRQPDCTCLHRRRKENVPVAQR